ncbi:hypothetical protein BJX66DRAFT_345667 [Aspergillus keveii]|uniref:Prion-inhibition and propagation HeLo domain-containing protein n=1 Tax=Aspergillus keveii TaxID=714993 RepID=A0ABR4FHR7_9EURO
MTTGLEVAGLALAIFPLLVNQLDNYARGIEKIRLLARWRRSLAEYALDIGTQHVIFQNTLEQVLDGVVDDTYDATELSNDPQSDLWSDSKVQTKLKRKLGRNYEVFIGNMTGAYSILFELSKRLGIDLTQADLASDLACKDIKPWKVLSTAVYTDLSQKLSNANGTLKILIEQPPNIATEYHTGEAAFCRVFANRVNMPKSS